MNDASQSNIREQRHPVLTRNFGSYQLHSPPRRASKGSRPLLPPFSNVTLFFFPFYPQMFSFKYRLLPLFASFQPFQLIQHRFRPSFLEIKPNIKKMRLKRGQKPVKDKSKGEWTVEEWEGKALRRSKQRRLQRVPELRKKKRRLN